MYRKDDDTFWYGGGIQEARSKIPRIGCYNGTSSSEHSSEETNSSSMPEETESLMLEDSDSSMFEKMTFYASTTT